MMLCDYTPDSYDRVQVQVSQPQVKCRSSIRSINKDCTSETRYSGCGRWKQEWSHEQRAFSEYIRHDPEFNVSSEAIVGISYDDAVGWPGFKEDVHRAYPILDCNENFLRHHTLEKSKTKESRAGSVMQALSQILQMTAAEPA